VCYRPAMWLLFILRAWAVDVDVTVRPPHAAPFSVRLLDVEPGPVGGSLVMPWFDRDTVVVDLELYRKKGIYRLNVILTQLVLTSSGTLKPVEVKSEMMAMQPDKRSSFSLRRGAPSEADERMEDVWVLEANLTQVPVAAPEP
jgi:hypothetical protein